MRSRSRPAVRVSRPISATRSTGVLSASLVTLQLQRRPNVLRRAICWRAKCDQAYGVDVVCLAQVIRRARRASALRASQPATRARGCGPRHGRGGWLPSPGPQAKASWLAVAEVLRARSSEETFVLPGNSASGFARGAIGRSSSLGDSSQAGRLLAPWQRRRTRVLGPANTEADCGAGELDLAEKREKRAA